MKTRYLIFTIAACVLLWVGIDIQTARVRFGSAYLNDSTSSQIAINKGMTVNGDLKTNSSDIYIADAYQLRMGDQNTYPQVGINGQINQLFAISNQFNWRTETNNNLVAQLDSANGFILNYGYLQAGATSPTISLKLVKGKLSGSTATAVSIAHGLDFRKIISFTSVAREDSASSEYIVAPAYGAGTQIFTSYIDSTNCVATTGGSGTTILNDSVFFYITYHK